MALLFSISQAPYPKPQHMVRTDNPRIVGRTWTSGDFDPL